MKQRRTALSYIKKLLPPLLRETASKNNSDMYFLNFHKKVCENKGFCGVVISFKDTKILEFNQYRHSDKIPNPEVLIRKVDVCWHNPEKLSTTKWDEHIHCGYSRLTIWRFFGIENQHDVCKGEDYIKKFCESLREHAMKINNSEKKKIIPLT